MACARGLRPPTPPNAPTTPPGLEPGRRAAAPRRSPPTARCQDSNLGNGRGTGNRRGGRSGRSQGRPHNHGAASNSDTPPWGQIAAARQKGLGEQGKELSHGRRHAVDICHGRTPAPAHPTRGGAQELGHPRRRPARFHAPPFQWPCPKRAPLTRQPRPRLQEHTEGQGRRACGGQTVHSAMAIQTGVTGRPSSRRNLCSTTRCRPAVTQWSPTRIRPNARPVRHLPAPLWLWPSGSGSGGDGRREGGALCPEPRSQP